MTRELLQTRSGIIRGIRSFFEERGFLEIETPLLSPYLIPEPSIENFSTTLVHPQRGDCPLFLIPSPEVWMKKALALGLGDLFQITKSFRNSEQISPLHNPEFTMIEWYKEQAKSQDNITLTEELLSSLKRKETPPSSQGPFRVMTMEEAFKEFAGFSLEVNLEEPALKEQCLRGGLSLSEGEDWESLFHKLFLTLVEPSLPQDRPLILRDYPHRLPTLARKIPGTPWADRWELYIHGIEVANCYSEEVDPKEMEVFFLREKEIKERQAQVPVIASPRWLEGMENLPTSSGVALGVDRLILTLLNLKSIEEVLLFPLAKILL